MEELEKPRLSRLTAIITLLQSKRIVTATELAEKYQVSTRTIYRDIRTLENSGVPLRTIEGKGYTLAEGYQLPAVMFTESEANALITAEQLILKNKDQSLVSEYVNATTKIKSVLRNSQREKTDLLADRIVFRTNQEEKQTSNHLMTIQSTITNYSLLDIIYCSLEQKTTKRQVEPFALYSTQGNWLMIAYCRLRKEFRVFRIDQINRLIVLDQKFEPHTITLPEYFEICRKKYQSTSDTPMS